MTTTISLSYSYLSASPIEAAYLWIDWNSPIVFLSNPERSLVQQAEENPLEYTLASSKDAFDYIRVLLKVLDQVTGPCDDANDHLALESPTKDAAEQYYLTHKTGVVTHYILQQLYSVVLILMENHYDPSGNNHNNNKKPTVATMFYNAQTGALLEDWRPLLRLLYQLSGDAFAQRNASLCLAYILLQAPPTMTTTANASKNEQQETIQSLIRWLTERLQESSSMSYSSKRKNINNHHNPSSSSIHVVTPTLMVLCTHPTARNDLASAGGIGYICRHLVQPSTTVQQQYELVFCLWTMTLDLNDHDHDHDHDTTNGEGASPQKSTAFLAKQFHRFAIPALCGLVKSAPREKITRLALASLCQLCTTKQQDFLRPIMGCGVYTSLERLKERQWTDPDAVEDLTRLHSILQEQYKEWTKWEVYLAELESGVLSWDSMLHTETFLRQHAKRMEDNNFWVIQRLLELLKIHLPKQLQQSLPMTIALPLTLSVVADNNDNDNDNNDESCLDIPAIALLDLGEFAKHYPNGRAVLHKLGAKPIIMAYMEHSNPNIQRQAILCTSKMLLQHHSQHVVVVGTEQK